MLEPLSQGLIGSRFRWAITGAAGFIGSHLVESLLALGQEVVGMDNFLSGSTKNLEEATEQLTDDERRRFTFIEGDIRNPEDCLALCRGVDIVLHQAALVSVPRSFEDPLLNNQCNVDGFLNVLLAAKKSGARSFVYASSAAVYGDGGEKILTEDASLNPKSPYAVAKMTDELYSQVFASDLNIAGLRYMNVYGPRQDPTSPYSGVISIWLSRIAQGQQPVIFGDGKNTRDFIYVKDVVQANIKAALFKGEKHEVFNIGTGNSVTLLDLLSVIRELYSEKTGKVAPEGTFAPFREGDIRYSKADISKAEKMLNYKPTYDLREGLDRTIDWFIFQRTG